MRGSCQVGRDGGMCRRWGRRSVQRVPGPRSLAGGPACRSGGLRGGPGFGLAAGGAARAAAGPGRLGRAEGAARGLPHQHQWHPAVLGAGAGGFSLLQFGPGTTGPHFCLALTWRSRHPARGEAHGHRQGLGRSPSLWRDGALASDGLATVERAEAGRQSESEPVSNCAGEAEAVAEADPQQRRRRQREQDVDDLMKEGRVEQRTSEKCEHDSERHDRAEQSGREQVAAKQGEGAQLQLYHDAACSDAADEELASGFFRARSEAELDGQRRRHPCGHGPLPGRRPRPGLIVQFVTEAYGRRDKCEAAGAAATAPTTPLQLLGAMAGGTRSGARGGGPAEPGRTRQYKKDLARGTAGSSGRSPRRRARRGGGGVPAPLEDHGFPSEEEARGRGPVARSSRPVAHFRRQGRTW
ncbi:unnamed protein product [Prorocentrum cordatum]|uniref:Uncharacterized protein n=1 Tax=Prorocentrum cordatum TaxID=2364126 RepID=A0ABN9QCS0_9DINO|nr:unnamed protein product [Polarella glacialis]